MEGCVVSEPIIAVLAGGVSSEREVSLGSGAASALALARHFPTRLYDITSEALPADLDPARHVVFSTLHGTFGEDGGMQRLLDAAGVHYAGCDAASSALTMDKVLTKRAAAARGVVGAKDVVFSADKKPSASEILAKLGEQLVLKPTDQGSSVGLHIITKRAELEIALESVTAGNWIVEQRIFGRELSVGVLKGHAMGVVEITPKSGVYDFTSKYTKGMTQYSAPANLGETVTAQVRSAAEAAFAACGCRDYARVDFIFSDKTGLFLLEINTLPGMKETSLLPMSAHCVGLDFSALVHELVLPALQRFRAAKVLSSA
jgi:D-alanine-D-alanine ligase